MAFQIVHNDICKMKTEAIVNAANSQLKMGNGVCGAIFKAANASKLQSECNKIGSCAVGEAVITKGYDLLAKYIIHAVGPIWQGGNAGEEKLLHSVYMNALELAKKNKIESIAIPLLSTGFFGYPKKEGMEVAVSTIKAFLEVNEMDVYLVVYDRGAVSLSEELVHSLTHYIETYYEDSSDYDNYKSIKSGQTSVFAGSCINFGIGGVIGGYVDSIKMKLEGLMKEVNETFSEMLLRLIDERGKTDVEVYKKANIDRKLFSKIRSNRNYNPKKTTVFALAMALQLSLCETQELLARAGYAFNMSHKGDIIIKFLIENEEYDLFKANETLFYFEQPLLGSI